MKCKICNSEVTFLFKSLVLNKYQVAYYKCPNCDFIQTEKPFWLEEAYNEAITDLDVGLVNRNIEYSKIIEKIIKNNFNCGKKFLDYAGGYGLFVRLMRDRGFDFFWDDKYCENIFVKNFSLSENKDIKNFEALTALEVFEHLEEPLAEIEKMLALSDSIIFSTELQPESKITNIDDWWYFAPETGQHIVFYSKKTFEYIAKKFGLFFFTNNSLHILTRVNFKENPLLDDRLNFDNKIELKSFIDIDFNFSKNILKNVKENKNKIKKYLDNDKKEAFLLEKVAFLDTKIEKTQSELTQTQSELTQTQSELTQTQSELTQTQSELKSERIKLTISNNQLNQIYNSREWKLALKLRKIFKKFFPVGSWRRKFLFDFLKFSNKIVRTIFKTKIKIFEIFLNIKNYFIKFKPKKKRKINLESKKIVFVDHSYHQKTGSAGFILEYLKKFFEVEIIFDKSWNGKGEKFPDLSFVDEKYLGIIFWQVLPNEEIIKRIKNDNIIYFPMYDQSGRLGLDFWEKYRNLKIINFSKTLHKKLKKWGFESIYVQFFPEINDFFPGKRDEVFFWQRLTDVNFDVIKKLFGDLAVKIHLHRAVDPDQTLLVPSKEDEEKFKISYSDWFDTRKEMWEVIKDKAIYVAPREYEGIGMSFLEAMAMGKAVVAVDNPTMNEYIKDGETGYLFDLNKPKKIDFSQIEKVQKNAYEFMKKGAEKWKKERKMIIDFIKKS